MDWNAVAAYFAVVVVAMSGSAASFRLLYASLSDLGTFVAGAFALALVVVAAVYGSRRGGRTSTPYW